MSMPSESQQDVRGRYGDGRAPVSTAVSVAFGPDALSFSGDGWPKPRVWPYADLAAAVPVGPGTRDCLLRSRAHAHETLFLEHPQLGAKLSAAAPHLTAARQRLRALRPGLGVTAAVAALVGALAVTGFSPAKQIAKVMPERARDAVGTNVVKSLAGEYRLCETRASRAALQRLTSRLAGAARMDPRKVKVRIVDWGLVNAFAVPGGHIVLTRGLLHRAGSSDEVAGVLAHELGHALELHPETGLVRSAGLGAAVQLMFAGSAGTMTNVGLLLTEIQYTRLAEQAADAHAVGILRAAGISAKGFADFFRRIDSPGERSIFNSALVRTHPLTSERIAFIKAQPVYPSTPALSLEDWNALQGACGRRTAAPDNEHTRIVADATRALARRPNDVRQLQRRARALSQLGRHADALADWDRVLRVTPADADAHVGRGAALDALDQPAAALKAYTDALRIAPGHAVARNRHALANRALKRFDEALEDFDILLAAAPQFASGHYNRGLVLIDLKRTDEAMRAFGNAIDLDKSYAAAYTHRGFVHMDAGRRQPAIAEFQLALAAKGRHDSTPWAHREAKRALQALGASERP